MNRMGVARIPPVVVVTAAVACTLAACSSQAPGAKAAAATPVALARVAQGDVSDERTGLGHVEGFNQTMVRAQAPGLIVKVKFTEGQSVVAGQTIVEIDPRPLEATVAQDLANAAKDQASLAQAVQLVTRNAPLAPNGVVSAQQLEADRAQVAELRATVAADAAVVRRDRLQLAYATVRAPAAGVTGLRLKDVGDLVGPTDPQGIVTIAQIQPIAVVFTLPQSDLAQIRQHMNAAGPTGLEVDAYDQGDGARLDVGRLLMIDNRVDAATGTITLKAIFPNATKQLWPGQFVNAHLVLDHRANAMTVPTSVVQRDDRGTYAWVVNSSGAAYPRPIAAGPALGARTVIEAGLHPGDQVVTDGQFALVPGTRVVAGGKAKAAPAAMRNTAPDTLGGIS